jgi:para-nitrobenzyl esterase
MLSTIAIIVAGGAEVPQPNISLACGVMLAGSALQTNFAKPVSAFRGIPFALPPTGSRRWLPPVPLVCPAEPNSTLDVSVRAPACWQNDLNTGGRLNISQSENCLTLDVYAQPHVLHTRRKVPVIAWIYGGSLVHGSTNSYAGLEGLAARGDIVLVAMNYRLASFGWLTPPPPGGGVGARGG